MEKKEGKSEFIVNAESVNAAVIDSIQIANAFSEHRYHKDIFIAIFKFLLPIYYKDYKPPKEAPKDEKTTSN